MARNYRDLNGWIYSFIGLFIYSANMFDVILKFLNILSKITIKSYIVSRKAIFLLDMETASDEIIF